MKENEQNINHMYSKQRSWQCCQCHPPHTTAESSTAHQNQHNHKTGPDVTSLIAAKEASRQWEQGAPMEVSGGGSPTSLQMEQSCWQRQHSACALLELQLLPSRLLCCWDKLLPRHEPTGQALHTSPAQSHIRPATDCWSAPTPSGQGHNHTGNQALLPMCFMKPGSECGQKPHMSRLLQGLFLWISQPLASLMHPGHSVFELQHFLELAPSK